MVIVISDKKRYSGTATPTDLNVETTIIEITGETDDYIVEGYIDVSALAEGDEIEIREYIAVDGTNYQLFIKVKLSGAQEEPVIRFHSKTLSYDVKYKVTITQTAGTLRSFPYRFIELVLGTA